MAPSVSEKVAPLALLRQLLEGLQSPKAYCLLYRIGYRVAWNSYPETRMEDEAWVFFHSLPAYQLSVRLGEICDYLDKLEPEVPGTVICNGYLGGRSVYCTLIRENLPEELR